MQKIICPNCGAEYMPSEIYIPKYFFDRPTYIEKDYEGKILDFFGSDMDLKENYTCDKCNRNFNVTCTLQFKTSIKQLSKHTTKFKKPNLFMTEE